MADDLLEELIALYKAYEEANGESSSAALSSFEEACNVQAAAKGIDNTKLKAFVRTRYYKQISSENRRIRRQD